MIELSDDLDKKNNLIEKNINEANDNNINKETGDSDKFENYIFMITLLIIFIQKNVVVQISKILYQHVMK